MGDVVVRAVIEKETAKAYLVTAGLPGVRDWAPKSQVSKVEVVTTVPRKSGGVFTIADLTMPEWLVKAKRWEVTDEAVARLGRALKALERGQDAD